MQSFFEENCDIDEVGCIDVLRSGGTWLCCSLALRAFDEVGVSPALTLQGLGTSDGERLRNDCHGDGCHSSSYWVLSWDQARRGNEEHLLSNSSMRDITWQHLGAYSEQVLSMDPSQLALQLTSAYYIWKRKRRISFIEWLYERYLSLVSVVFVQ